MFNLTAPDASPITPRPLAPLGAAEPPTNGEPSRVGQTSPRGIQRVHQWSLATLGAVSIPPFDTNPESQAGWAAGVVDGEGCFHIAKQRYRDPARAHRPCYVGRVTVSQSDYGALMRIQTLIGCGGKIYRGHRTAQQNKTPWNLVYQGLSAYDAARALLPRLVIKSAQAVVLLEFERDGQVHQRSGPKGHDPEIWRIREAYYQKMKRMK